MLAMRPVVHPPEFSEIGRQRIVKKVVELRAAFNTGQCWEPEAVCAPPTGYVDVGIGVDSECELVFGTVEGHTWVFRLEDGSDRLEFMG